MDVTFQEGRHGLNTNVNIRMSICDNAVKDHNREQKRKNRVNNLDWKDQRSDIWDKD